MSKTLTLRSKFLNILNESLQKISIENGIKVVKNPFMEADGNFTSVIQTNNTFNPNDINSNIIHKKIYPFSLRTEKEIHFLQF